MEQKGVTPPTPEGEISKREGIRTKVLMRDRKIVKVEERNIIDQARKKALREAIEKDDQEQIKKLKQELGLTEEKQTDEGTENKLAIDKERLNALIQTSAKEGALFGYEVNLTDEDRNQI